MLFIFHSTRFSSPLVSLYLIPVIFMLLHLSTHLGCQSQLNLLVSAYKKPTQTSKGDPVKVNKNVCVSKASQNNPELCFFYLFFITARTGFKWPLKSRTCMGLVLLNSEKKGTGHILGKRQLGKDNKVWKSKFHRSYGEV